MSLLWRYFGARMLSGLAMQMQAVTVGWQIYDLTRSPLRLGLVGLAQFLPMLLLTLAAGHAADRFDRRVVAGVCRLLSGGLVLCLAGASAGLGGISITPGMVYAAVVLLGASRAFENPAQTALLPALVPPERFARAAALSTSAGQTAFILGPSIGGLLYAFGAAVPYTLAGCALLASGVLTLGIQVLHATERRRPAGVDAVLGGIRFIWANPAVLGAISLDLFAVLLGGATALLPVYARDILHAGPTALGLLRAAPACGALAVSVLLARFRLQRHVGAIMFSAVVVFGLATMVFAVSRHALLSVAALLVIGGSDVFSVVIRQTLVQLRTPDEMRGRVSAVNSLFIGTSNQLGEFESGVTAALVGAVPAVLLGGAGTVLVALVWMRLFPGLRRMDRFEAEPVPEPV